MQEAAFDMHTEFHRASMESLYVICGQLEKRKNTYGKMKEYKEEDDMAPIDRIIQDIFEGAGDVKQQIAAIQKLMAAKTKEGPGDDLIVWKAELSKLEQAFRTLLRLRDIQQDEDIRPFKIHKLSVITR